MTNVDFEDIPREQPRWSWWLAGIGLVAAILVAGSVLSPGVRHQLAVSVFRQNTPYTPLGFNDATALPTTAVRGKPIQLSFFITNDEGKPVSYQYVVASGSAAKLASLTSATKTVPAGTTWKVTTTVTPKCEQTACRVQVSLPQLNESIDFNFQYKSAKKAK